MGAALGANSTISAAGDTSGGMFIVGVGGNTASIAFVARMVARVGVGVAAIGTA